MTDNRTVVSSLSSLSSMSFIDSLPADKHALHDIRFRFKVDNIWSIIAINHPELKPNDVSKDIVLDPILTHDLTIKTTIHHTDTVSVIVACSLNPIAADTKGLLRLSNALTRVEERLLRYMECRSLSLSSSSSIPIPEHNSWTVTMWHLGSDSLNEYAGERFESTWEDGENALLRIYTKDLKNHKGIRIRRERQEYPNKRFDEAMGEKLRVVTERRRQAVRRCLNQSTARVYTYMSLFLIGNLSYKSGISIKSFSILCSPAKQPAILLWKEVNLSHSSRGLFSNTYV